MENVKLSEEVLNSIKELQQSRQVVVLELGEIALAKLSLEDREGSAENFLAEMRAKEVELTKTLEQEYGKGTINLETGEFTPIEE
jgi:hypothetical protein